MSEKRRLNLSFSMAQPRQREVWRILSAMPAGQRTGAVCRMVLEHRRQEELLEAVHAAVREEFQQYHKTGQNIPQEQRDTGDVGNDVLNFLQSLQDNDE